MREIKLEILWLKHNRDFTTEIATHYTTVDRLCTGEDKFKYKDVEIVAKRQFTGSHDINGYEIYEGDIMECNHKCLWQVSFNFKTGCFVAHNPADIEDYCFLYDWDYEIIGNIHQNKELLK